MQPAPVPSAAAAAAADPISSPPAPSEAAPSPFDGLPPVAPFVDQLILWLIEHPGEPKKRAAEFFRVQVGWVYTLTQSDLFKARMQDVLRNIGVKPALGDLHAKLAGALEMSVDRLISELQTSADPTFAYKVAQLLLQQKAGPTVAVQVNNQTNVTYQVDARTAAVADARSRMLTDARTALAARPAPSPADVLQPMDGDQ